MWVHKHIVGLIQLIGKEGEIRPQQRSGATGSIIKRYFKLN